MTQKHIFLFNGPPRSGKDSAAIFFKEKLRESCYAYKMAYPLKEACHKILGLFGGLPELEYLKEIPLDFELTDVFKESYNEKMIGRKLNVIEDTITLREFYIHMSENVIKPLFGNDYFGKLAVKYIENQPQNIITISDSGFRDEALPLIDTFGAENITLVQVHRPNHDFTIDSRKYVDLTDKNVKLITLHNDTDLNTFGKKVLTLLDK